MGRLRTRVRTDVNEKGIFTKLNSQKGNTNIRRSTSRKPEVRVHLCAYTIYPRSVLGFFCLLSPRDASPALTPRVGAEFPPSRLGTELAAAVSRLEPPDPGGPVPREHASVTRIPESLKSWSPEIHAQVERTSSRSSAFDNSTTEAQLLSKSMFCVLSHCCFE